jgi:hypothetical protein
MLMEFREFVKLYEAIQRHSNPQISNATSWGQLGIVSPPHANVFGAMPTQWTGSQWPDEALRSGGFMGSNWVNGKFDLGLPSVAKTSQIKFIDEKKNPILIFLADGTKLYMPYDSYKKINVQPEVGRTLMVVFQRRKDDASEAPSQIQTIKCY